MVSLLMLGVCFVTPFTNHISDPGHADQAVFAEKSLFLL